MSWRDVAYKNVHDASRSRTVWLVSGVLALLFVGYAVVHGFLGEATFVAFVDGLVGIVATFLPALGILLGYRSISDDREDGSLLLALAFPLSRRDLVVGTALGRIAVLVVPTLATLALAGVVGAIQYGIDGALRYPWFVLATCLYGTAFVGVGIGLSIATTLGPPDHVRRGRGVPAPFDPLVGARLLRYRRSPPVRSLGCHA
jgi:ABC-type transport system involved in multi-copper enzyme maturation permease subunit